MVIRYHGRISLPKRAADGIIRDSWYKLPKEIRKYSQYDEKMPQGSYDLLAGDQLIRRMQPLFTQQLQVDRKESGWIAFRRVEQHKDDMFYYLGGVRASFLHVVLQGNATVRDWSGGISVKRGDVFSLTPHAKHSVPTDTYCLTVCFVVHPECIK